MPWPIHPLPFAQTPVGRAAWRASLLLDHADYLHEHPSLLVTHPDDPPDLLARLAPMIQPYPVMLSIREPRYARRLPETITARLSALKLATAEFVTIFVDDPSDLKSGASIQHLFDLRSRGLFKHIALAHPDVRMAEWLALHTPAVALLLPYHLADQSARHRALGAAYDNGIVPLALGPAWFSTGDAAPPNSSASIRFSLGESGRILPILEAPIEPGLVPMSTDEIEAAWQDYSSMHKAPEPLPRSLPPE